MRKLKRDQRVCPYCAETIKVSAIKCRYCQSDLPPLEIPPERSPSAPTAEPGETTVVDVESSTEVERKPAPPPPPPSTPAPSSEPQAATTSSGRSWSVPSLEDVRTFVVQRLTMVLAVAVALAAAGVGLAWWDAERGSSDVAPGGALIGEAARTEVLVSAADLTQRALSYSHESLESDMEVARARMTPTFRKEYDATMEQVRANTEKNKIVLDAAVVSSAIIEATEKRAKVLVFLNQTTSAGEGKDKDQQLMRNSLVIELRRSGGDWDLHQLDAIG